MRVLGVIPARFNSSRFLGKPLQPILGVPMIKRVYLRALQSKLLTKLVVATDNEKIQRYCQSEGIAVIMTSSSCKTGTDRVAEVARKIKADLYVNIQGDEPVIEAQSIDELISEYEEFKDEYLAYNLYKKTTLKEASRKSIIKVVTNEKNELLYMSRALIPFSKEDKKVSFKKQVCVYGFSFRALELFSRQNKGINEKYEDIEILRFLDMGFKVKMKETKFSSISVDELGDIKLVEAFLKKNHLV